MTATGAINYIRTMRGGDLKFADWATFVITWNEPCKIAIKVVLTQKGGETGDWSLNIVQMSYERELVARYGFLAGLIASSVWVALLKCIFHRMPVASVRRSMCDAGG